MKKTILSLIIASATLFAGSGLSKEKLEELKSSSKVLQNSTITIVKGKDLGSVYFLRLLAKGQKGDRRLEGFYDKKTGAVYLGGGFDRDGKQLSFPIEQSIVDKGVVLTYGNGPKELYVITDPECPYCTKFATESKGKLDGYTVNVILMPLPFHKSAKLMINYVLDGSTNEEKAKRYKELMEDKSEKYKDVKMDEKRMDEYLGKVVPAVTELNVKGTPSFFVKENKLLKSIGWVELLDSVEKKVEKEKK